MELKKIDIHELRSIYIEHLNRLISRYENGYYPELKECTGFSQYHYAERYKNELSEMLENTNDWKSKEILLNEIGQIASVLQIAAKKAYRDAIDFKNNPYIKIPRLKKCIRFIQYLKYIEPKAEIYSNRYLAS